jgi:DNA repair exonuclease SbcCD ATPase subunit
VAIKIPFVSEVTDFLRGTKKLEAALDNVVDSLDDITDAGSDVDSKVGSSLEDVGRSADDASRKVDDLGSDLKDVSKVDTSGVESEIKEIGTAADTSAEKLETSFSSAFDKLRTEGRTATDKTKSNLKSVGDEGSATLREFNQEAKQNVSETVSSFDGSASSAVDAVQGTFGGLVSALGPAGVVGAAFAGVGIGMARNLFSKAQERADELAEAVAEMAGQFIDLGKTALGVDQVNEKLKELASTAADVKFWRDDKSVTELDKLKETADKAKISWRDFARGVAGDSTSLQTSYDQITAKLKGWTEATQEDRFAHIYEIHALEDARDKLEDMDGTLGAATVTAGSYADATADGATAAKDSAKALEEENEQLRESATLKGEAVTSELDMLDAIQDVTKARKDNGKSLDKNTEQGRDNLRALKSGIDAINEFGDAQINAGKDTATVNTKLDQQEDALVNKVARAFGISRAKARDYIATLGGIPRRKDTDVDVSDKGSAQATQNRIKGIKGHEVELTVRPDMPTEAEMQRTINAYYSGLSIKVPVALDQYRSGKTVP